MDRPEEGRAAGEAPQMRCSLRFPLAGIANERKADEFYKKANPGSLADGPPALLHPGIFSWSFPLAAANSDFITP